MKCYSTFQAQARRGEATQIAEEHKYARNDLLRISSSQYIGGRFRAETVGNECLSMTWKHPGKQESA